MLELLKFLFGAVGSYGFPIVIALPSFLTILYIIYKLFHKKLLSDNEPIHKCIDCVQPQLEKFKINQQIFLEILGKILEKQESSLTNDQACIVIDSILDSLITQIMSKTLDVYVSNNIINNEELIRKTLMNEIEALIRDTDRNIESLPNINDLVISTKEKIKTMENILDIIINIMKVEKYEREAAKKFKSIYSTTIKNNWML